MRRLAMKAAIFGLFLAAGASWLGGCGPTTCAIRGVVGAVVMYLVAKIALGLVIRIIADTAVRARLQQDDRSRTNT